jgi:hypothetical protein
MSTFNTFVKKHLMLLLYSESSNLTTTVLGGDLMEVSSHDLSYLRV